MAGHVTAQITLRLRSIAAEVAGEVPLRGVVPEDVGLERALLRAGVAASHLLAGERHLLRATHASTTLPPSRGCTWLRTPVWVRIWVFRLEKSRER